MNEWEFTAEVASWINEFIAKNPSLPFLRAKCEQTSKGSQKRRDLTLIDKNSQIVLTGEVKLPYNSEGGSPYNSNVMEDAKKKAIKAKSSFFFTWNINQFVLWESSSVQRGWQNHQYKSWSVTSIHKPEHLDLPVTLHAIQYWLPEFLSEFARILRGVSDIGIKSPDEKFIEALESSLDLPIKMTFDELSKRYSRGRFKAELDDWMRMDQGWIIYDDPDGIRDNLERAAKFTCYALVNKLVFYEALLKRYAARLDKVIVPQHITIGDDLRRHLEGFFEQAKSVTRDYETVFGEDRTSIGNRIPFYSDNAVPYWRGLIHQIHVFDFSKLDFEIIGNIFERLISPTERKKYGQFYTRVEVVDLINSFCIQKGDELILDPACGGGTFLVRAYVRKRELCPNRKHGILLSDIFGVDISLFAAHLTTINLATRDLIDEENYPQIVRNDFFNIRANKTFISLPHKILIKGLGKIQHRPVEIPQLDAIIGNPPYVRQEEIPKTPKLKKSHPKPGTKEFYLRLVEEESGAELSGRSDIHCYFWPHASSFLKDNGFLCFLTSSQWLDVEYGFALQSWILNNFEILAILESFVEPWFIGARVGTAITILRKQSNELKRNNNKIRFVQLRRALNEILSSDGTTAGAIYSAEQFKNEILSIQENTTCDRYRIRVESQGELLKQGILLGNVMTNTIEEEGDSEKINRAYYGGKWGVYLRAPDIWFKLIENTKNRWDRVINILNIKYGIKTGCDEFFYVKDVSERELAKIIEKDLFENKWGVSRKNVLQGKVKLVACGKSYGEIRAIEAKYLEPEIHSIMDVDAFAIKAQNCPKLVLLISAKKEELKNTLALDYIKWGEKQGIHSLPTCSSREKENREWYDLTGHLHAPVLWPKARQYRHLAPANPDRFVANCSFYELYPPDDYDNPELWGGILNSSWVLLSSFQFGRSIGNEGHFSTMVVDTKMMIIPDPRKATKKQNTKVMQAFSELKKRKPLQFISERRLREMAFIQAGKEKQLDGLSNICELDMPDRKILDEAVLEMVGIGSKIQRLELIEELYKYLREFFEATRQKEEKAIFNKRIAKHRSPTKPSEIALSIFKDIQENNKLILKKYDTDYFDKSLLFDTVEIPKVGTPRIFSDMFTPFGIEFISGKNKRISILKAENAEQAELIVLLSQSGTDDLVRIPRNKEACQKLTAAYREFVLERENIIRSLIEERTADEDLQAKILDAIMPIINGYKT